MKLFWPDLTFPPINLWSYLRNSKSMKSLEDYQLIDKLEKEVQMLEEENRRLKEYKSFIQSYFLSQK